MFNAEAIQKELGGYIPANKGGGPSSPSTARRGESVKGDRGSKSSSRGSIKKSIVSLFRSSSQPGMVIVQV